MNTVLEKILRTGYTMSPNGKSIKVHSAISREEGEFLQEIISELKPVMSLEIGLAYGISALFICDALEKTVNTRHIIIDPNQYGGPWGDSWEGIGLNNLREAGYEEIIDFFNMPSYRALPQLEAQGCKIDFAFVDGWHTFDYTMNDFFYIDKMLRLGGIVAFDDANWPGIHKTCRYIVTNRSYSVVGCFLHRRKQLIKRVLLNGFLLVPFISKKMRQTLGQCIAYRKESEDKRPWNFHHPF